MADQKSAEVGFRESLQDFVAIGEILLPHCLTPEEMLEVARLALTNDAQLRILLVLLDQRKKERRG